MHDVNVHFVIRNPDRLARLYNTNCCSYARGPIRDEVNQLPDLVILIERPVGSLIIRGNMYNFTPGFFLHFLASSSLSSINRGCIGPFASRISVSSVKVLHALIAKEVWSQKTCAALLVIALHNGTRIVMAPGLHAAAFLAIQTFAIIPIPRV
jgi:hypothetical protein